MVYVLILAWVAYSFWRGVCILKTGEARRWEVVPFFGVVGASALGKDKVHGTLARVAGVLHIAMGVFGIVALIFAVARS